MQTLIHYPKFLGENCIYVIMYSFGIILLFHSGVYVLILTFLAMQTLVNTSGEQFCLIYDAEDITSSNKRETNKSNKPTIESWAEPS